MVGAAIHRACVNGYATQLHVKRATAGRPYTIKQIF